MDKRDKFSEKINLRLFKSELVQLQRIMRHARDQQGKRKYCSLGHIVRCALMQFINREQFSIDVKLGRPKK